MERLFLRISRVFVLFSALTQMPAWAHGDLLLQIEELGRQIEEAASPDVELYFRRGDLYRRHGSWDDATADFTRVRALDPANVDVDWFEGRMRVEQGQFEPACNLLSRFLAVNGPHAGALRFRAMARWGLQDPAGAAADYAAAVRATDSPSPGVYRSWVIAELASGSSDTARSVIDEGLERFPMEVSLLGLGADLALTHGEVSKAQYYLDRVPARIERLPQWRLRHWLMACVVGASPSLDDLPVIESAEAGAQSGIVLAGLAQLNLSAEPEDCRRAAGGMISARKP